MQLKSERRSNRQRSEATRAALVDAARRLFIAAGYAATSTPEIVAAAGVTRGALYHHFADKRALFRAVVETESAAVARRIDEAAVPQSSVRDALLRGADAYFAAMSLPGRTRLLLLDGPAVLGRTVMDEIDKAHAGGTLRRGLAQGIEQGELPPLPANAVAAVLSAAFDRAALEIEAGADSADYRTALEALIGGLLLSHP